MRLLWISPLLLAGCVAPPQEPLTDAQRALALQMLMSRPAVQMPQVEYRPMQVQPPPRQFTCTTVPMGGGETTTRCTN